MTYTSPGFCPKCEGGMLNYEPSEAYDDTLIYPYVCNDCGFVGKEVYYVEFVEHQDKDGFVVL